MEKKDRFSLRKLKNGVVSVALGSLLVVAGTVTAEAAENDGVDFDAEVEVQDEPVTDLFEDSSGVPDDNGGGQSENTTPEVDGTKEVESYGVAAVSFSREKNVQAAGRSGSDKYNEPVQENLKDETQTVNQDESVRVNTGKTEEVVVSEPEVFRYGGLDREEVAINVAKDHFKEAEKVIIVNQDMFPDSISATNISQGEYPVLYTRAGQLGSKTFNYLGDMTNLKEIYLLGGTTSINDSIVTQLTDRFGSTVDITRIDGKDRFEANTNAIRKGYADEDGNVIKHDHVVIATGEIYTDALYGVSFANSIDAPIVLSKTDRLVDSTIQLLKDMGTSKITIIGGTNSVNHSIFDQLVSGGFRPQSIERIAGETRYDGSVEVARETFTEGPVNVLIASGDVHTDALVSAPLAQKLNGPIILVRKDSTVDEVKAYLKEIAPTVENIYIQGGTSTVNKANENEIKELATHKVDEAVIVNATVTVQVTGDNEVAARFVNEEEDFDETYTFTTEEELIDGENNTVTFTYNGEAYAVNFLYVTGEKFVETVEGLTPLSEIENIETTEELKKLEKAIEEAENLYNALTEEAKANEEVIEKMAWIGAKKKAIEAREKELETKA